MRRVVIAAVLFMAATSAFAYDYAMWVPGWGSDQLNSIQMNAGALKESNPVWYGWNSDGTLRKKTNSENPTWRAAMAGTLIIPTVQNTTASGFDGTAVANMLNTAVSREAHATMLAQLAISQAFDGIDVDYENISSAQKANFTAFLTTLSQKLHAVGKKLSVCVSGKTDDTETWSGPGGNDYAAIGQVADSVKIMGYDFHWDGSQAGAIAPLDWLDKIATYAERLVPAKKIMFGLPFYGYDWSGTSGTDVSYAQAMATAQRVGATITRDVNGEATYTYGGRTVFFQDATSFQRKIEMLKQKHPSIGGFTAWAIGQEDPEIWKIIRGTSSGVTPVASDFTISGPSSIRVEQGSNVTADYRVVPINGFNATSTISFLTPAGFGGTVTAAATAVAANTPVTVSVGVSPTTPNGIYPIIVRFTSGSLVHEQGINLTVLRAVAAVGDFAVAGPSVLSAKQGRAVAADYSIAPVNGFSSTAAVTFIAPSTFQGTITASSGSAAANAPVTVRITPSVTTPAGVYQIVVRFTSGALVHDRVINLAVKPAKMSWKK